MQATWQHDNTCWTTAIDDQVAEKTINTSLWWTRTQAGSTTEESRQGADYNAENPDTQTALTPFLVNAQYQTSVLCGWWPLELDSISECQNDVIKTCLKAYRELSVHTPYKACFFFIKHTSKIFCLETAPDNGPEWTTGYRTSVCSDTRGKPSWTTPNLAQVQVTRLLALKPSSRTQETAWPTQFHFCHK